MGTVKPIGGSEAVGGEGGYPVDKMSTTIRKDISRGTRNFLCGSFCVDQYLYADVWPGFFGGRREGTHRWARSDP